MSFQKTYSCRKPFCSETIYNSFWLFTRIGATLTSQNLFHHCMYASYIWLFNESKKLVPVDWLFLRLVLLTRLYGARITPAGFCLFLQLIEDLCTTLFLFIILVYTLEHQKCINLIRYCERWRRLMLWDNEPYKKLLYKSTLNWIEESFFSHVFISSKTSK